MRTYTVVPSFEGESAFFDLPDIGFQGDHLSFAILFNLNELVEHWPNVIPSMIVTDPKGNTYIAPYTRWNGETHIFTWIISSTETTYEGYLKCQLKCTSADDPNTIVCMSRICQTRVYQSLEAASDPPEAFQTWIDTLVELGAQINVDASAILDSVEVTQTNARAAQAAADEANLAKTASQQIRSEVETAARIAANAQEAATQARLGAQTAAQDAATARDAAQAVAQSASETLEEIDAQLEQTRRAASNASDSATQAAASATAANTARNDAVAAKDAAVAAKGAAETAQSRAEAAEAIAQAAQVASETARTAAETAQTAAETAQTASEAARDRSETAADSADTYKTAAQAARDRAETARVGVETYAEIAKKWAIGKDNNDNNVPSTDDAYENNSKYWANVAERQAGMVLNYGLYVDSEGHGYIRSL